MTRSSLSRRIHRTKHLEEELHEIRETEVDGAEHMPFRKIGEGHVASIIFFLTSFGKDRGYMEPSPPWSGRAPQPRSQGRDSRPVVRLAESKANNRALELGEDC